MMSGDVFSLARLSDLLRNLHDDLDLLSYYHLLGIPPDADREALREAYHGRALMLHPDRYLQVSDDGLRERVSLVYKRIAEAYRVLSNPETRAKYDALLARGQRRYSAEALDSLQVGDVAAAPRSAGTEPSKQGAASPERTPGERLQSRQAQELLALAKDFMRRMEFGKAAPLLEQALSVEPSSVRLRQALEECLRLKKMYGG